MPNSLRVLQMIDSLSIGGAERVSVNYANALSEIEGIESFHCTTREEGLLKKFLKDDVTRFFMNKKSTLDVKAFRNLIKFIKENQIGIVHAHSSSFFTAIIVKFFTKVKIVWHDHYGLSEELVERKSSVLKLASFLFSKVISVNTNLEDWAKSELHVDEENIQYLPNYAELTFSEVKPDLAGSNTTRIVVLANLREQKDHMTMLKAFNKLLDKGFNQWHVLFVGRDWNDDYSDSLKQYIEKFNLNKNIHILGGRSDTAEILKESTIGVLSSRSEGLPVALLEYGLAGLPVIATDVGECKAVLDEGKVGMLISSGDVDSLAHCLETLMLDEHVRKDYAQQYTHFINKKYSKNSIIKHVIKTYHTI